MKPKLTGNRCQCTACGENFSRERVFDRHRIGGYGLNRHCLTVAEMTARGWRRNDAGCWVNDPLQAAGRARIRPYYGTARVTQRPDSRAQKTDGARP